MLLVMLAAICAYGYLFQKLRHLNADNVALTRDTGTLLAEQSQIGAIKQSLSDTDVNRAKLDSYFVDPNNVVPFLETVEGYAKAVGVTTTFSDVQLDGKPPHLSVTVDANGSFANVYQFVSMLEAAPYEISITSSDIRSAIPAGLVPTGVGDHSTGWDATLNLSVLSVRGATQ